MYRDLKDHSAAILANPNVRLLLGEPIDSCIIDGDDGATSIVSDPLIELHSVVDADSSQIEAIEMAKSGKSFVLQGPPGTGKSPTMWCWSRCSALWTPAAPSSRCSCISLWASHGRIMRANPCAIKSISVPWRHWKKASIKISKKACFSSGNLIEYQC